MKAISSMHLLQGMQGIQGIQGIQGMQGMQGMQGLFSFILPSGLIVTTMDEICTS